MDSYEGQFEAHPSRGVVSYWLQVPPGTQAILSLGHGAGAGMRHDHMSALADMFLSMGIAVFRYQFPFMERGGGRDALDMSLSTVAKAAQTAKSQFPDLPLFAGGHSFGGRMTTTAAAQGMLVEVSKVVLCSFPLHTPGKPGAARGAHLFEVDQPMLFLSGDRDSFVEKEIWGSLIAELGPRATLAWLSGADHGWKTRKTDPLALSNVYETARDEIRQWLHL